MFLIFFAKIHPFSETTKFQPFFFRLPQNIERAKIPAGQLCLQPHQAPKGATYTPSVLSRLDRAIRTKSKLFQERSKPLQESKSTFILWKVKKRHCLVLIRRIQYSIFSFILKVSNLKYTSLQCKNCAPTDQQKFAN